MKCVRCLIRFGLPIGARVGCYESGRGDDLDRLRQHLLDGGQRGLLRGGCTRNDLQRPEAEERGLSGVSRIG